MTRRLAILILLSSGCASAQRFAFTVSMERPSRHYYHVVLRCDGLTGETQDFKMPVWMPGYYRIMDYPKDVVNFSATDNARRALPWRKINKNTWRVKAAGAAQITISYDVYGFTRFVANDYLDDQRGYVVGPGMYMHVAGLLDHPVTVTFKTYEDWTVANGLDPLPGPSNTFSAPNFDLLYDCPTLFGKQERFQFEVKGVPHYIVAEDVPPEIDRSRIAADLKKIVENATAMMGDVPYKHYTFLLMGRGNGGVEHLTSAAMFFDGKSMTTPEGYRRWLSFAAHEYFHTFNVKRIRPVALGPFDYDRENYTTMLWEAEGFTSYYQDLILRRAGLVTPQQYFETLTRNISAYENSAGHLFQSAAESSLDTWISGGDAANTTISYYNKGPAIAAMLDFKIRAETRNQKSLDDVMRALYSEFYEQKKRGFTDEEFRQVCERIAGVSLAEIFDVYVATTKEIDYAKYFGLAGLKIDTDVRGLPGAYLGAFTGGGGRGGRGAAPPNVISRVEYDSPADHAGLSAQDEILAIDGTSIETRGPAEIVNTKKPGDRIKILIARDGRIRQIEVVLGSRMERSFKIQPIENPDALQAQILKSWLAN